MEDVSNLSRDEWKAKFVAYYTSNAPTKVSMVSDAMMDKWEGRYDTLYANLEKKYGALGAPIEPPPAAPPRRGPPALRGPPARLGAEPAQGGDAAAAGGGGAKPCIADFHDEFVDLVARAVPPGATDGAAAAAAVVSAVETKAAGSRGGGLETSTFTLVTRIRPTLSHEQGLGGEHFTCVVPGPIEYDDDGAATEKKRQADARILIKHSTHAIALRSDPSPSLPRALRPLTPTERLLRTSGIVFCTHRRSEARSRHEQGKTRVVSQVELAHEPM